MSNKNTRPASSAAVTEVPPGASSEESSDEGGAPSATVTKSPFEWQKVLGVPALAHAAAEGLHYWADHRYHAAEEIQLTEADYKAALKAAASPAKGRTYQPHQPARSKYAPRTGDTEK